MADDLASQLAGVMVKAANLAAGNHSTWPIGAVQAEIAADLRRIMETTDLPEWYAGYEAGCREQTAAQSDTAPRLYSMPGRCAVCGHFRENHKEGPRCICGCRFYREPVVQLVPEGYDEDDYACSDYTPDERHRHTVGGQTWEHAHEGGHEAHSAVSHDLFGARLLCRATRDDEVCARSAGHDGYHDSGVLTWADAGADLLQSLHELAEDLDNGHPPADAAETVRWAANVLEGRR